MSGFIREWILGIVCGAMAAAVLQGLMPEGGAKKVGKLVGGLLLTVVTVQPLLSLDMDSMAVSITRLRLGELEAYGNTAMKSIIEGETEAYILDKAEMFGAACVVEVSCRYDEETGLFYPDGVEITGALTDSERMELTKVIEADLAIPAEKQVYVEEAE